MRDGDHVIPRLHQSTAKVLVMDCPAIAKAQYDAERRAPSRAMEKGTLVDQLVFGGSNFHVIDADSYRTKKAQEERDTARENGMVPVLAEEFEPARKLAGLIKSRLALEGLELDKCAKQHTVQWQTPEGVLAEGTPDLFLGADTIDLKVGHTANPDKLEQHIYEMGYHIQGAAYQEAVSYRADGEYAATGRHWLVCAETKSGADCITIAPLSPAYIDLGMRAWRRAQMIWVKCWQTNEWPEYTARPLQPTKNAMFREGLSP